MTALLLLTALFGSPDPFLAAIDHAEDELVADSQGREELRDLNAAGVAVDQRYRGVDFLLASFDAKSALSDFQ